MILTTLKRKTMRRGFMRSWMRRWGSIWRSFSSRIRSSISMACGMYGSPSQIVWCLLFSHVERKRNTLLQQCLRYRGLLPWPTDPIRSPKIHIKPPLDLRQKIRHPSMGGDPRLLAPNNLVLRRVLPPLLQRRILPRQHLQQICAFDQ